MLRKWEVELIDGDAGWPPYLSVRDAEKLDDVREALTLIRKCAVKRRGTSVGESPTRQMLPQSVAIGAET